MLCVMLYALLVHVMRYILRVTCKGYMLHFTCYAVHVTCSVLRGVFYIC